MLKKEHKKIYMLEERFIFKDFERLSLRNDNKNDNKKEYNLKR